MSDFTVPVIEIEKVTKHPNADTLSITEVEGCPVIFRTGDFQEGDLAVYIPIESVIDENGPAGKACPFLKSKNGSHRVKAVRLRGIFSMGILVNPSAIARFMSTTAWMEYPLGTDVKDLIGVTKYEEPETFYQGGGGKVVSGPQGIDPGWSPVYGVNHYRKNKRILVPGEEVVVTEKLHGCNFRAAFHQGKVWVGSHHMFRKRPEKATWYIKLANRFLRFLKRKPLRINDRPDTWWTALEEHGLEAKLRDSRLSSKILYGEIYGPVQDLKYGSPDAVKFAAFDVFDIKTGRFLDYDDTAKILADLGIPMVPVLYRGPYDPAVIEPMADGMSTIAPEQIREGIVIRPVKERHEFCGRAVLKLVGESYLLRKGGSEAK